MFYRFFCYFKFLLRSTNQHGVHSPFVYNLVTKCFYNKTKFNAYKLIAKFSKNATKNKLKISSKNKVITKKETKFLFLIVNYFKFKTILELETAIGITTHALHLGNPEAKITTIEGCPNISVFTKGAFKQFNLKNIEILTGNLSKVIKPLTKNNYDLIYFDGNHQKEATLSYFETLLSTATNDSVFIFDNIYWSKPMTEAWETIKNHPKVTVTIDTFFLGIVFFRKEQVKEHFTIRV